MAGHSLYITTTDGVRHEVVNDANVYLRIDGDSYRLTRTWRPRTTGNAPIPEGFFGESGEPRGEAAEDADRVYTESFRPENGSSDSAVPPTDPEEGWIMSLVFIDSGNINNKTGLDTSKKLNKGNGKYVSLYIENIA